MHPIFWATSLSKVSTPFPEQTSCVHGTSRYTKTSPSERQTTSRNVAQSIEREASEKAVSNMKKLLLLLHVATVSLGAPQISPAANPYGAEEYLQGSNSVDILERP